MFEISGNTIHYFFSRTLNMPVFMGFLITIFLRKKDLELFLLSSSCVFLGINNFSSSISFTPNLGNFLLRRVKIPPLWGFIELSLIFRSGRKFCFCRLLIKFESLESDFEFFRIRKIPSVGGFFNVDEQPIVKIRNKDVYFIKLCLS